MSTKINLYWYKHSEGNGNFGDALNPYLVEKLSKCEIRHFDISLLNHNKFLNLKILVNSLFVRKISMIQFVDYLIYDYLRHKKVILAIGSILRYTNGKNLIVWGSGIIKSSAEFGEAKFLAVRGHYTKKRLVELGYNLPIALGDPALLLPIVYNPKINKEFKLGIIPHFIHYEELKHLNNEQIRVVNLLDPIEKVVDEILSCEHIISTSLHGIIVSHAYNIPALWVDFKSEARLFGDNIKFKDYFSSVNLKEYEAFSINKNKINLHEIAKLFSANRELTVVKEEVVRNIQKLLLKTAPFEVKTEVIKKYAN